MAVRGFQPLYNLAFFERSLLPLPPSKDPFARNGTSGREFFAPSSEGGGRDACCIDVRSLFVCWLFVSPRSLTLIARRQRFIIPGFGNKTSPLSLSFLYKYSSVIWSEARDNVWWERRRNSIHRWTRAWIGINFPESERVSIRKAPYGRSLLIPVKFNGVDSPNRLTQLSNEPRCHGTHSNSSRADRYPWTCVRDRKRRGFF